ncbi:hypothetical protein BBAD15_g6924 [Beauveria bassiana D1-5]|uniref:Chromo domain-containing protein n=1 Tax=Beauveria bassiana D1-5 TaxID=1245745 RepID=A0A0A2VJI8_BEABA|nr:hypothetical protein BBAD15_g6924 [Beauveria bassiana D1-5]
MANTDGAGQSSVTPRPNERPTKARLLVDCYDSDGSDCNDGSDSGIDTNGRQSDNANPRPGRSHEGETTANVEHSSEDCVSPELEDSNGSEGPAWQAGRTHIVSNGGHSDNDSIANSGIPAQIKASNERDHTTLAGSACSNNYPGQSIASLLVDLQCIREYRTSASDKCDTPYFELECLGQDGQWYWIAESDVQRSVPSAVGTFWGCGPEDWIAPETKGGETGREVWKRPLATDGDGVPDALLIMGRKASRSGQIEYLIQKVGYPASQPTWHDEETVKERYTHEHERYRLNHTDYPELMDGEEPQLSAIVGHRLNGERGSQKRIQLSCHWTNETETWEAEDEVQKKYNAAVLTYWQSDLKARHSCKVPNRRLRILGHVESRTKLLLKSRWWVGPLVTGVRHVGVFRVARVLIAPPTSHESQSKDCY